MQMRNLDTVTGTLERLVLPAGLRHSRRHRIAGLALAVITAQPFASWGRNESTGEDLTSPYPVVDQTDNTGFHGNERSVTPAASPPGEEEGAPATDAGQTSAEKYDLALGESIFKRTCLTCHWDSSRDAPRISDIHVWQPRLAQGLDVLIQHAREGHGRMVAKGGYSALTDLEVGSAAAYLYQSGMEILVNQEAILLQEGCDPVSNIDQCSQEELKNLVVIRMLLMLLGGGKQQ